MAASVRAFYQVADWDMTGNPNVSGVAWQNGDVIVHIGMTDEDAATLNTPTNANLTFTSRITGGSGSPWVRISTATATSTETSQTISVTQSGSPFGNGAAVIVFDGVTVTGIATFGPNQSTGADNVTVAANDTVVYVNGYWQVNGFNARTQTTGSGTITEHHDAGTPANYCRFIGSWLDTSSGTFAFGITSYAQFDTHVELGIVLPAEAAAGSLVAHRQRPATTMLITR